MDNSDAAEKHQDERKDSAHALVFSVIVLNGEARPDEARFTDHFIPYEHDGYVDHLKASLFPGAGDPERLKS